MPAYDFDLVHEETGEVLATVTAVLPIGERNKLTLRRRTVPRSIVVAGSAPDAPSQEREVMRSYHKLEEKQGSRFRSGFQAEQIKAAWKD